MRLMKSGVMGLSTVTMYSFSWLLPARRILFTMSPSLVRKMRPDVAFGGADNANWFVESEVKRLGFYVYQAAVHFYAVAAGNFGAQLRPFTVYSYPPLFDQFVGFAARTKTGVANKFIQAGKVVFWHKAKIRANSVSALFRAETLAFWLGSCFGLCATDQGEVFIYIKLHLSS